jgi:hypothetical protein
VKRYSPDRHPRFLPAVKHAEKQKQTINAAKKKEEKKKKKKRNKTKARSFNPETPTGIS